MVDYMDHLVWEDNRIRYDLDVFPEIEETTHEGRTVAAYTNQQETLDETLREAVREVPDKEAFVFPETGERFTFAEFDRVIDRVATGLQKAGITAGDVVSMLLRNEREFIELVFACARIGATAAPANTQLTARECSNVFENTHPELLVADAAHSSMVTQLEYPIQNSTYIVGNSDRFEAYRTLRPSDPDINPVDTDASTPVLILYTSGTTGTPKGCLIDNFHLMNLVGNYEFYYGGDRYPSLVTVPLFHAAGICTGVLPSVARQGKTVILDGTGPMEFLETMASENVTFYMGVPTHFVLLTERTDPSAYDLSEWEYAVFGGAPMPERAIERLRQAFPKVKLGNGYGMTEISSGLATYCPDESIDERPGSVGLPTPPVELAVVDENREPQEPGTIGKLAIKGPFVAREYVNQPEKTEEAFNDGWHLSGDLAVIDSDGFVELKGRERDRIIKGGENIYPLDIEEALIQHEGVLEATVVSFPDEVLGERILAAVVPKETARLTEQDLRAVCDERLAPYKHPDIFRIMDELPRNPNGKVEKSELVPEPLHHGIRAANRSDT